MNRSILTAMVIGASLMSSAAMHAATRSYYTVSAPSTHASSRAHLVAFSLRNDSNAPLKLRAGSRQLVIKSGATVDVKLPVGVNIVAEDATPNRAAGAVLVQVASLLGDATVELK
jgi:hypothetical protein